MTVSSATLRRCVIVAFLAIGIGLLPWSIWLSHTLSSTHDARRWNVAWSGFDTGLAVAFVLTAVAAWRRSPWVGACAAATGTLLLTDAWFDVLLESHADELRNAIVLALFAELPLAAVCFWIAYRTERFLATIVEAALGSPSHLAAAGERTAEFRGLYHVLGGALSPLDGVEPSQLRIDELLHRVERNGVQEVVLATNPNMTGEATAAYLADRLRGRVRVTRLASGLPMGGDLEYADEVTLGRALTGRREML